MKILFIANRVPYPPYRGDKLKIYNLAKQLHAHNTLHLITIAENKNELDYSKDLEPFFNKIDIVLLPSWKSKLNVLAAIFSKLPFQVAYFRSIKFKRLLETIDISQYDAVHVQHLRMSMYALPYISNKMVLDLPDAFSLYWKRRAEQSNSFFIKTFNSIEAKRLEQFEKKILPKFSINLVCNHQDQRYLKENTGANIEILQNGVDIETFTPNFENRIAHRILFTGNMDYAPNVDGVIYFVQEIFPLITSKHPNAQFIIAGQRPVEKVKALAQHNIEVTGFIPNLADEYNKASVVVAPLRFGAGTQNKVLEAMACAVPVVCTDIGFEGLEVKNGQGIWSFTDKQLFANQVITLLEEAELNQNAGKEGNKHVTQHFSWLGISKKLINYFNKQ